MHGVFEEAADDEHVARRRAVLHQEAWYAPPVPGTPPSATFGDLMGDPSLLLEGLDRDGFAHVRLDRRLANAELVAVAAQLGPPLPQLDPRMAEYVEDGVVLQLRQEHPESGDRDWKLLFSEDYVMVHSELAGRPVELQPRFQLFQCVAAPAADKGGQTLLVDMVDLCGRLGPAAVAVLVRTRDATFAASPPIVRFADARPVVSFKDPEGGFPWECTDAGADARVVNDAIRRLLACAYDAEHVRGVHWDSHVLAVFDNHRWLHARSRGLAQPGRPPRHLAEVRVGSAGAPRALAAARS